MTSKRAKDGSREADARCVDVVVRVDGTVTVFCERLRTISSMPYSKRRKGKQSSGRNTPNPTTAQDDKLTSEGANEDNGVQSNDANDKELLQGNPKSICAQFKPEFIRQTGLVLFAQLNDPVRPPRERKREF